MAPASSKVTDMPCTEILLNGPKSFVGGTGPHEHRRQARRFCWRITYRTIGRNSNMNLESEVEARNNICQKVERLCGELGSQHSSPTTSRRAGYRWHAGYDFRSCRQTSIFLLISDSSGPLCRWTGCIHRERAGVLVEDSPWPFCPGHFYCLDGVYEVPILPLYSCKLIF